MSVFSRVKVLGLREELGARLPSGRELEHQREQ